MKKIISIVTPTYNESENIGLLIEEIRKQMILFSEKYDYEHIIIDNDSTDNTVDIIKKYCKDDANVKLIVNSRNFGQANSPYHALQQANGDAIILMTSDFQDPIELIPNHITNWESGYLISINVKNESEENFLFYNLRKLYYSLLGKMSQTELIKNYTGTGLYDRRIIDILRNMEDPNPYLRGLICEIGFKKAIVNYKQPLRKRGITKNNFYSLYDIGMVGITSYSKIPLRLATMLGFIMSALSFIVAIVYLILKLTFWYDYPAGNAPMVIGLFLFASIQLFFIGILGEYIGSIHTIVQNRPLVIEKERVNF